MDRYGLAPYKAFPTTCHHRKPLRMFEIQPIDPSFYRQQTRRSTLIIALIFLALAMLCATASTQVFGTPGGDNFTWNLLGVLVGLGLTIAWYASNSGRGRSWRLPCMAGASNAA